MTGWGVFVGLTLNLTLAAVPVVALVYGVRTLRAVQAFRGRALTARGVVSDEKTRWETVGGDERARVTYPVLRFTTAQGQTVEAVSFVRSWPMDHLDAGEDVDVLYLPDDPGRACVDTFAGTGTRRGVVITVPGIAFGVLCIMLFGAAALQLVTLLVLAAAAVVVLARPAVFWRTTGALVHRPDLAAAGDTGPYTAERFAAGGLLGFALLALLWV